MDKPGTAPNTPSIAGKPEDAENCQKMFETAFHSWDETRVAHFIIDHIPGAKNGDQITEEGKAVIKFINDNKITGIKLKDIKREEWKVVVDGLAKIITLPRLPENSGRMTHPLITTLMEIPSKLQDASQGIWCMAMKFFSRVPQYDAYYEEGLVWCHDRAGRPYFNPAGWRRYGFFPMKGESQEQIDEIFKNWHVAYHGTKFKNADSIVEHGLVPPGTQVGGLQVANSRGSVGADRSGQIPIYLSPSIEYASHYLYTTPTEVGSEWVTAVFQVRVRPGSFKIQGNTLWKEGWGDPKVLFDRKFGPDELEWLVSNADDVRVTGLMIKKETNDPKKAVMQKFKVHQEMCSKVRAPGKGKWFFNSAPTGGPVMSEAGPFQAYKAEENERIEKAFGNWQSHFYLGKVDTDIGVNQYYIDFEKMVQFRCNNHNLFRRVKREALSG